MQDAGAALPARLLKASTGMRVVDLCAAPGGKGAAIALTGARLTAVDRSAERLKRLAVNFERLRVNAEIAVADALSFDAPPFDAVLLDAPCTATGTIRRHPDVAWTKRLGDLAPLAALQAQLLDKAVALTRPGGVLVYCTCSLEPEEGESQIAALLRRNPDVRRAADRSRRDRRPDRMSFIRRRSCARCPVICAGRRRACPASMASSPPGCGAGIRAPRSLRAAAHGSCNQMRETDLRTGDANRRARLVGDPTLSGLAATADC